MSSEDVIIAAFERCMPVKTGMISGNECLPIAGTAGVAAAEVDLSVLIGASPGCWITVECRSNGPLYIGMNKAATGATSLTAGTGSLGERVLSTDKNAEFWVTSDFKFCEVIADLASTAYTIRRSNRNRRLRKGAGTSL